MQQALEVLVGPEAKVLSDEGGLLGCCRSVLVEPLCQSR